ncbi:hypothetical protein WKI13_20680 [Teredinibacter turnerae]|uniref:hypothetical protein n=1 Tax=Teredinibacter turnerae TaxID=2426 RepID=UPI0003716E9F|nr:hypothetical protein [Teredinibacter turnerae]
MSELRILQIRESIKEAQRIEANNHQLRMFLEAKLPELHRSIALPKSDGLHSLEEFVTRYIEHVPDFLEALTELTKSAGVYEYAETFLTIAEDYFFNPPELVERRDGLLALIDEAYLAHRLIEEVNDRVMMASGMPLAPMDMTLSNIIVHDLLGDDFANQLDLAVHYSIESLFESDNFFRKADFKNYLNHQNGEAWQSAMARWPCLAGDSAIKLELNHQAPGSPMH